MKAPDKERVPLSFALEARGWFWEDDRLYAPHKTFWIEGNSGRDFLPPTQMLQSMCAKIKPTLERFPEIKHLYPDAKQFQDWVEDTESLVNTLEAVLAEEKNPL